MHFYTKFNIFWIKYLSWWCLSLFVLVRIWWCFFFQSVNPSTVQWTSLLFQFRLVFSSHLTFQLLLTSAHTNDKRPCWLWVCILISGVRLLSDYKCTYFSRINFSWCALTRLVSKYYGDEEYPCHLLWYTQQASGYRISIGNGNCHTAKAWENICYENTKSMPPFNNSKELSAAHLRQSMDIIKKKLDTMN